MRTKIICSIGPSTESESTIKELIENGMDIARLNFSHDVHKAHAERINNVRKWGKKLNKKVKVLCDLQGPKIRINDFKGPAKKIEEGKVYFFTTSKPENKNEIGIEDEYLHSDLNINDLILVDDGQLQFIVKNLSDRKIEALATTSGLLFPKKGVNVPLTKTTTGSLTAKDHRDLEFIKTLKPEWIAISFVQSEKDVLDLRKLIKGTKIKIMVKIERAKAIENLPEILKVSDAIMVARGDLGSELPIEKLPLIQKQIIKQCNFFGIPVVTATQMLASMVDSAVPTRAEVTDIANAVFDGTDAVMLSNETAVGMYPIQALKVLTKTINETENYLFSRENKL